MIIFQFRSGAIRKNQYVRLPRWVITRVRARVTPTLKLNILFYFSKPPKNHVVDLCFVYVFTLKLWPIAKPQSYTWSEIPAICAYPLNRSQRVYTNNAWRSNSSVRTPEWCGSVDLKLPGPCQCLSNYQTFLYFETDPIAMLTFLPSYHWVSESEVSLAISLVQDTKYRVQTLDDLWSKIT